MRKNEIDSEALFKTLNFAHPKIEFTCETEKDNSLSFLDVLPTRRQDGSIKPATSQKTSCVDHYTRFRKICTTDTLDDEIKRIENVLRENKYPGEFIVLHNQNG